MRQPPSDPRRLHADFSLMLDKVTDGAASSCSIESGSNDPSSTAACSTLTPRIARRTDGASIPSPKMLRAVLNLTSDLVLFFDPEVLRFTDVNEAACAALGYSRRELLTMELAEIVAPEARDLVASALCRSELETIATVDEIVALKRRDGSEFPIETTVRRFDRKRQSLAVLVGRDATERKCLEQLATVPAYLDPLTGLPNRTVLETRLQAATSRAGKTSGRLALLLVDLNHFKQVNDQRGHLAGDAVLKIVAGRLSNCVRSGDLVVRYGGDEFVILADGLVEVQEAAGLAQRIVTAVSQPIALSEDEVHVSASVGIAIASAEDSSGGISRASLSSLIAHADRGMYEAKAAGRHGNYVIRDGQGL
jgi:diguanylate cyclase (GGDEF)-like protein/PAS domain S-box-containing protein